MSSFVDANARDARFSCFLFYTSILGAVFAFSSGRTAQAGNLFAGDLNRDSTLDIADVIALQTLVDSGQPVMGFDIIFGDANKDDAVNQADVDYLVDVLLGRAPALRFEIPIIAEPVSLWRPPNPSTLATEQATAPGTVSFWRRPNPSGLVTQEAAAPAAVSYWRKANPSTADEKAVAPAAVSFWFMFMARPANGADAAQLGTPSFDRQ